MRANVRRIPCLLPMLPPPCIIVAGYRTAGPGAEARGADVGSRLCPCRAARQSRNDAPTDGTRFKTGDRSYPGLDLTKRASHQGAGFRARTQRSGHRKSRLCRTWAEGGAANSWCSRAQLQGERDLTSKPALDRCEAEGMTRRQDQIVFIDAAATSAGAQSGPHMGHALGQRRPRFGEGQKGRHLLSYSTQRATWR